MPRLVTLASWLILLPSSSLAATIFVDPMPSPAAQNAVESAFLAASGSTVDIDFDDIAAGPVTGSEWSADGLVLSNPDPPGGLQLFETTANFTPHSNPNCLFPTGPAKRIRMEFSPPRLAVGFWLIDSEYTIPDEYIAFMGVGGDEIARIPMPATGSLTAGPEGNFFIGIQSDDLVAAILVNELETEPQGSEDVGVDDVRLGTPAMAVEPAGKAVLSAMLGPASPNPFAESTRLRFRVPERSRVILRVFDSAGRLVRSLLDSTVNAGEHSVRWNGRGDGGVRSAPGVYWFRLQVRGGVEMHHAILLE